MYDFFQNILGEKQTINTCIGLLSLHYTAARYSSGTKIR